MNGTREQGDFGYKAFYRGRVIEVYAENALAAQTKAATIFRAHKAHQVVVVCCERPDGSTVTHSTSEF